MRFTLRAYRDAEARWQQARTPATFAVFAALADRLQALRKVAPNAFPETYNG